MRPSCRWKRCRRRARCVLRLLHSSPKVGRAAQEVRGRDLDVSMEADTVEMDDELRLEPVVGFPEGRCVVEMCLLSRARINKGRPSARARSLEFVRWSSRWARAERASKVDNSRLWQLVRREGALRVALGCTWDTEKKRGSSLEPPRSRRCQFCGAPHLPRQYRFISRNQFFHISVSQRGLHSGLSYNSQ